MPKKINFSSDVSENNIENEVNFTKKLVLLIPLAIFIFDPKKKVTPTQVPML
jgi:hypothetical protein